MECNIYLADDDPDDRELFKDAIQEVVQDSRLFLFQNGVSLIEHLKNDRIFLPDIIFLDINMPMINGKMCLQEIRKIDLYRMIPVIMFTTSANARDVKECFEGGANLFVNKPVNYKGLVDSITQVFYMYKTDQLFWQPKEQFVLSAVPLC